MNSCFVIFHALKPATRNACARSRRALTLIEMLVAVTITLMVILAIVQVFGLLGENIKTGQAVIEVTTDLRFISQQLQDDLDGITCPVRTWLDPSEASGGFEYYDGPSRDRDWNAIYDPNNQGYDIAYGEDSSMGDVDDYLWMTTRNNVTPFSGRIPELGHDESGNIVETVRYADSKDAEVTWWTALVVTNAAPNTLIQLPDLMGPSAGGRLPPTSSVALFRNARLIIPGIDLSPLDADSPGGNFENGRYAESLQDVLDFLDNYDVSVRWVASGENGTNRDVLMPNSLANLTQRQNRFMRFAYIDENGLQPADASARLDAPEISATYGEGGFPFPLASATLPSELNDTEYAQPNRSETKAFSEVLEAFDKTKWNAWKQNLQVKRPRFVRFPYAISVFALSDGQSGGTDEQLTMAADSYKYYSSIMARSLVSDNIRAFDVRAFDPMALLYVETTQRNIILAPGDPGYPDNNPPAANGQSHKNSVLPAGQGAYVDLQYAAGTSIADPSFLGAGANGNSIFTVDLFEDLADGDGDFVDSAFRFQPLAGFPPKALVGWWPYYDTWSTKYERDGVNQYSHSFNIGTNVIDEGTNETDDTRPIRMRALDGSAMSSTFGVDDAFERETAGYLAYDTPLRGIKVSIRKMDYESRQIRQTSVVGDFVPE